VAIERAVRLARAGYAAAGGAPSRMRRVLSEAGVILLLLAIASE